MRKIKYLLIIVLLITINVKAQGSINVSPSEIEIEEGSTKEITIVSNNVAGRLDIVSKDGSIANVKIDSETYVESDKTWVDTDKNKTANKTLSIKGLKEGTTKVEIQLTDVTDYDEERVTGTKTINVKVVKSVKGDTDYNKSYSGNNGETIKNVPKTASNTSVLIYGVVGAFVIAGIGFLCYSNAKSNNK